jgi:hypothetical protein
MDVTCLSSPQQLGLWYLAQKRILVYLPLVVNLAIFKVMFVPLFLDNTTQSSLKWYTNIEHVPEVLSMLGFFFTLWTFGGNYIMKEISIDKESQSVKIKFDGLIPASANLLLAVGRIALYYVLDDSRRTQTMKVKLLYVGIALAGSAAVSLYYTLAYSLDIRGSSLPFYIKTGKLWKYVHTVVSVTLLVFFSFFYSNALVQSVVRILCVIVTFHLIMKLLNNRQAFYKINYVDSVADVKPIFLLLAFALYFHCFEILDLRLRGKSLDGTFKGGMLDGCVQALAYYIISCRHRFYMEASPILKCVHYGAALDDSLMKSAFKRRQKAVVRVVSQFNYYFLKRSFKILDRTTFEMEKDLKFSSRSYWSEILAKSPDIAEKLAEYMPKKGSQESKQAKDLSVVRRVLNYVWEVSAVDPVHPRPLHLAAGQLSRRHEEGRPSVLHPLRLHHLQLRSARTHREDPLRCVHHGHSRLVLDVLQDGRHGADDQVQSLPARADHGRGRAARGLEILQAHLPACRVHQSRAWYHVARKELGSATPRLQFHLLRVDGG